MKLIGCQDVCKQPVAGTRVDGCLQWFGGLDQSKRQRALIDLVNDGNRGPVSPPCWPRPAPRSEPESRRVSGQFKEASTEPALRPIGQEAPRNMSNVTL